MKIGLSIRCFYKFLNPVSKEAIKLARQLGSNVIEINVQMPERLKLLNDITKEDLTDFEYVSCHGLGHDIMIKIDTNGHREVLDYFQRLYERIHFNCLILHPGIWIADWEIFNDYSFPIAFENMDWRHVVGIGVESMREILQKKNSKMV